MRALDHLRVEHVGKHDPRGVERCSRVPGYRDFQQGRKRFADHVEIDRRIALLLPGHNLLVAFDQLVAGQMAATRGVVPHHRLVDDDRTMRCRFDLGLSSILAPLVPKQAHKQWTNCRFTAVELEE